MMKVEIRESKDGSNTLYNVDLDETYHSVHGAIQEAQHVFIDAGLKVKMEKETPFSILEIGFGTGLNALLTIKELLDISFSVTYVGIEKFPISEELWKTLNYPDIIGLKDCFEVLHNAEWDKKNRINESFLFEKRTTDILDFHSESKFDLIYFDAFSPTSQPELWTIEVFKSMYDALNKNGILVTYCAKGQVRRDLQTAGFHMERLPGPPGKREMLRGTKL